LLPDLIFKKHNAPNSKKGKKEKKKEKREKVKPPTHISNYATARVQTLFWSVHFLSVELRLVSSYIRRTRDNYDDSDNDDDDDDKNWKVRDLPPVSVVVSVFKRDAACVDGAATRRHADCDVAAS